MRARALRAGAPAMDRSAKRRPPCAGAPYRWVLPGTAEAVGTRPCLLHVCQSQPACKCMRCGRLMSTRVVDQQVVRAGPVAACHLPSAAARRACPAATACGRQCRPTQPRPERHTGADAARPPGSGGRPHSKAPWWNQAHAGSGESEAAPAALCMPCRHRQSGV